MRCRVNSCVAAGLVAFVISVNAVNAQPPKITDTSFRITIPGSYLQRVADDVYAIIHDNPTDQWPTSNTGIIIGKKYVMVIDANYLPSIARSDIELIKKVTDKPVRYLVYTHWHMDHNNGGSVYKEAFPGIDIISQRMTAEYIEINSPWYAKRETAVNSAKRQSLAQLEKDFATKKDKDGKELTEENLQSLDTIIRKRKNELLEFETLKVVKPNRVFESELTLDLGDRKVYIKDWGRANSPHDATIYLPKEQILFTGDMLMQAPKPYTGESWPVSWAKVLKEVEKIPVTKIVPGHGPVLYGHDYTRQMRGLLETTIAKVKEMLAQGMPVDQMPNAIDLEHLRKGVWNNGTATDAVWKATISTLVDRTVKCVRGQGGVAE
jgi:glyoxylase-like metal-dependent hydrolase (beta-lactamase superfamily II)